ncbi:MAG: hypothetical protein H0X42_04095 [Solirubrobacterales bacterium]|nr:hypothetical protein [Solirubrobacterales bacterium]
MGGRPRRYGPRADRGPDLQPGPAVPESASGSVSAADQARHTVQDPTREGTPCAAVASGVMDLTEKPGDATDQGDECLCRVACAEQADQTGPKGERAEEA